jgi:hypothetical protein
LRVETVAEPLLPRKASKAACGARTVPVVRGLRNAHAPVAAATGADADEPPVPGAPIVDGGCVRERASVPSSIVSRRCLAWPTGPGCLVGAIGEV